MFFLSHFYLPQISFQHCSVAFYFLFLLVTGESCCQSYQRFSQVLALPVSSSSLCIQCKDFALRKNCCCLVLTSTYSCFGALFALFFFFSEGEQVSIPKQHGFSSKEVTALGCTLKLSIV